jgi:YfiH family protein
MGGVSEGMFSTLNLSYNRGDKKEAVDENFRRISEAIGFDHTKLVFSNQIHETRIHKVTKEDCGKVMKDMDGLATNEQGIPLYTGYADCVPLFFYDPVEKAAALAHSGWRGTVGRIGAKMVQFLENEYGSKKENIIAAIRRIHQGGFAASQKITDILMSTAAGEAHAEPDKATDTAELSDRELQIFTMIGEGLRNKDIAPRIGVSEKTVATYKARLMVKLGINSTKDLLEHFRKHSAQ